MKMHKQNTCVKIQLEVGHEATLREEITPQGFTHDWVVFVRGVDNAEIHHFVEKVVFNLHESFPKPKRVIKEPPYEVRESGYASFAFPIEVYLKSKEEPRKLEFLYDLSLNTNGPIRTSQREKKYINNPSEEFRRKLIRGGGVGVGSDLLPLSDNNSQNTDDKSSSKKSSSDSKKHKFKDSVKGDDRTSNQFADLFGTPIKTAKLSPTTTSKRSDSKHSVEKVPSKSLSKHSPHKEKEISKKDTLNSSSSKEKDKDRERSKEKEKKADKSLKRPTSPAATPPPAKVIKEEPKKSSHEEAKERDKIKSSSSDVSKNEKKDKKKDKKVRDEKDKKDRHKDHEIKKEIATVAAPPPTPIIEKERVPEKPDKIKSEFKESKENIKKSPKYVVKEEKVKEKNDKEKTESIEKQRHKHKKKEKDKKEEKESKEKEKPSKKSEKLPPAPPIIPKEPSPPPPPLQSKSKIRSPVNKPGCNPLTALILELPKSDIGSDSESSVDDDEKSVEKVKISPPRLPPPPAPNPPVARTPERVKEEKFTKDKLKKKDKKNPKDEDGSRKKKRKSKEEVIPEKPSKMKGEEDNAVVREELVDEEVDERLSEPSPIINSPQREDQEVSRSRSPSPLKFTEEYVMELKDLQQKIMTLEDNAELQRVVQVIAETGQYEITKKTFDFDLCALDKSTVKRLQDLFFAAS